MIDIRIPYKENDLAGAYNEAMMNSNKDWVLLLDHDLFLATNKHWYVILKEAIEKAPENTALITCKLSHTLPDRPQWTDYQINRDQVDLHVKIAIALQRKHGTVLQEVKDNHIAGAFMLVNKKAWEQVKFRNVGKGIRFIDWDFCDRVLKKGLKIFVLPGLYIYHGKKVKNKI